MLTHAYGSGIFSGERAFEWHQRFREGRASAEDDRRSRRPQTSLTAENIEKVSAAVRKKRLQTISQIAESVEISKDTCQQKQAKNHRACYNTSFPTI
ncbi:hypothetical protein TNCV_1522201 [Trichonephila clavipes]|nr:hypothetical protein TNCV_1522201 [Trichonephila clavipes]